MVTNKEKNFVSAIAYIFNNEDIIKNFLREINDTLRANFEKYEIIIINDASTDESKKKIQEFAAETNDTVISIINMSYYQGLEMGMNAGLDLAIGDFVFEFDNIFLDYDMETIMTVYRKSLEGFDIVSATSNTNKRKSSNIFYKIFNNYSKNPYKLNTESFRILSRRAINRIQSICMTIPYRKAIYANCGLKLCTITYVSTKSVRPRTIKQTEESRRELAIESLILFTDIAGKLSIYMTGLFLLAMIATAIYTVVVFISGEPVAGWTTTMSLLSFAFFGIFAFFAIIIKYLSIIVNLIFKKQKYTIESIEKITK